MRKCEKYKVALLKICESDTALKIYFQFEHKVGEYFSLIYGYWLFSIWT